MMPLTWGLLSTPPSVTSGLVSMKPGTSGSTS
jgi:hypothetical protein